MGSGPDLWFAVGFVPIVQTLPKWHICPNLGRICRCNGVFQCFQFIHALTFGLSVVVWVGVLGERRPGMSQDSRQSLYIYTRCQRMGGKSVVQTMKPDIRQLRPF